LPCSFCGGQEGVNVLTVTKLDDVWNSPMAKQHRETLLKNGRKCPYFDI
jgi:hypothetical protein